MDASSRATSFRADGTADSARIRWDEATIAEHDKERGSRRKILEPKTPYRPPSAISSASSVCSTHSDDMQPDAATEGRLQAALNSSGAWESGSEAGSHGYRDAVDEWDSVTERSPREPSGTTGVASGGGTAGTDAGEAPTVPHAPDLFRSGSWSSVGSRGSGRRRSRDSSSGAGADGGGAGGGGYTSDSSTGSRSSRRSVSSLSTGGRRRRAGVDLHARFADETAPAAPSITGAPAVPPMGVGAAAHSLRAEQPPTASTGKGSGAGASPSSPASPPPGKAELRNKRASHYKGEGLLLRQALAKAKAAMEADEEEEEDTDVEGDGGAALKRGHGRERGGSKDSPGSDMEST